MAKTHQNDQLCTLCAEHSMQSCDTKMQKQKTMKAINKHTKEQKRSNNPLDGLILIGCKAIQQRK